MHGQGDGKAVFLGKINLPPSHSLLLLSGHAFLSCAPLFPHFPPSHCFPPLSFSLFLAPQALLTVYPYTLVAVGRWDWEVWGDGGHRWMREKDSERTEGFVLHLFFAAMGYTLKSIHTSNTLCR